MKRILYSLLIALGLTALLALLDYLGFGEEFGLWTYTLGAVSGLALVLLGLLYSIFKLLFSRRKGSGLALGAQIILIGLVTFGLALLIWLAVGKPAPAARFAASIPIIQLEKDLNPPLQIEVFSCLEVILSPPLPEQKAPLRPYPGLLLRPGHRIGFFPC
ncbi:MAG: hypothetical protein ACOX2G_05345 [Bacillota bacterium]